MSLKLNYLYIYIILLLVFSILQYIIVGVNIYNLYNIDNKIFSSISKKKNSYKISYTYNFNIIYLSAKYLNFK